MTTKTKLGRPRVADTDLKKARSFRVSDRAYDDWTARATSLGIRVSDILETAVNRELKRLERKAQ